MFEDALLESSLRQRAVLRRIHYLILACAGTVVFALGLNILPLMLGPVPDRGLYVAASIAGAAGTLYVLMLCYVWEDARRQGWRAWPWLILTLLVNLPGFLVYLAFSARKTGDWKRLAMPLAYVAEALIVGGLILVPLIYTQALPTQLLFTHDHILPPPGRPPAPAVTPHTQAPEHHMAVDPYTAPARIPDRIIRIVDRMDPPPINGPVGPYVVGAPKDWGSGNGYVPGGAPWVTQALPPPPPAVHSAPRQQMVRVSSGVIAARALYQPSPNYPPLARMAHVQGTVALQAVISKEGTIEDLKVLSGHPLLVGAALEAVKSWRYQPTLLNTEPVEVLTEIDVIFRLDD